MLLDRWEADVEQKIQRLDISQWGNRAHLRNMFHEGQALNVKSPVEWNMPPLETFVFDYSSGKRLAANEVPLGEEPFSSILRGLYTTELDSRAQIDVLRMVSDRINLKSLQMRE